MKAQLGKPTGLVLALLTTLLATFLAMGVFSVAQANEHNATRSFSERQVGWHLAPKLGGYHRISLITEITGEC